MDLVLIGIIAFFTSLISGMLGLGGAVLLIPAYLYLPSLFGTKALDIKSISGMTSLQVFAAALLGMFFHSKKGAVDKKLVWTMGIPITVSAFFGALLSGKIAPDIIIGIFAVLAITGAFLMFTKKANDDETLSKEIEYNIFGAVSISIGVGFFGGIVGAPGAFIIAPLMMTVLKIPTRITIGSTLGIVLLSAFSASLGKIAAGLVPWEATSVAILSSIPGVYLGTFMSHKLKAKTLRFALAILVAGVGVQMIYKILF